MRTGKDNICLTDVIKRWVSLHPPSLSVSPLPALIIPVAGHLHSHLQSRAIRHTPRADVLINPLAANLVERVALEIEALLAGRYPHILNQHSPSRSLHINLAIDGFMGNMGRNGSVSERACVFSIKRRFVGKLFCACIIIKIHL
jgi:hypothetical protein